MLVKKGILLFFILQSVFLSAQDAHFTVYFDFNAPELNSTERNKLLFFLSDSLDKTRMYEIEIKGYCDFIDDDSYNNLLSQQRADFVKQVLLDNGIRENAIVLCKGYGEKTADIKKSTEEERQLQRRVELSFICTCHNQETVLENSDTEQDDTTDEINETYFVQGDIDITNYEVGDKFALESLHFIGGRHKLLPESIPALKNLLQVMKENPNLQIVIIGHICCEPDTSIDGYDYDTHTYDLSVNRAKEIYEYLIRNGIDKKRMAYKGVGGTQKIFPFETSESQRTANRRVEIEIADM